MHKTCFNLWEAEVLAYVRNTGRAKNWSDKQLQQNLWAKKGFDIACKACDCLCGQGRIRKDLSLLPYKSAKVDEKKRRRKKSGPPLSLIIGGSSGKSTGVLTSPTSLGVSMNDQSALSGSPSNLGPRMRSRTLSLGSAAGVLGSAVGVHAPSSLSNRHLAKKASLSGFSTESHFFTDQQVQYTGSIFRHRDSLSGLFAHLPNWKRNGIHVKVKHDNRDVYMHAICVQCLERPGQLRCRRCSSRDWFLGDRLVLGTLYAYDVLASCTCCTPLCRSCRTALPPVGARPFSMYSELNKCPNCGHADFHFSRRLDNVERIGAGLA